MDRLEFTLVVALVLAIAGGVGYRQYTASRPPLQPVVVYGHSQFQPYEPTATPSPVRIAAATTGVPSVTPTVVAPAPPQAPPAATAADDPGLALLNHASQARLEEVPGIGPVLAQQVLTARQSRGGFVNWTELSDVPGIGDKRL